MIKDLLKTGSNIRYKKGVHDFPFIPISIFLVVVFIFWNKMISIIKSIVKWTPTEEAAIVKQNTAYRKKKLISTDGYFLSSTGVKQKYSTAVARQQAEELGAILRTGQDVSWYDRIPVYFTSSEEQRIRNILNPGFVHSHRKYIIDTYRDHVTKSRNLQSDVRTSGFLKNLKFDERMVKFFTI
jgi:hypothetical protein